MDLSAADIAAVVCVRRCPGNGAIASLFLLGCRGSLDRMAIARPCDWRMVGSPANQTFFGSSDKAYRRNRMHQIRRRLFGFMPDAIGAGSVIRDVATPYAMKILMTVILIAVAAAITFGQWAIVMGNDDFSHYGPQNYKVFTY